MPLTPELIDQPQEQDWIEALKEVMTLLDSIPSIKHVDIWMEQPEAEFQGESETIPKPAAFVSFLAEEVGDMAHPVQHIKGVFKIWLYLATNAASDTSAPAGNRSDFFQFQGIMKDIHRKLHGVSGTHFSNMHRVGISEEAAAPMQLLYSQTFQCNIVDFTAAPDGAQVQPTGITVEGDQVDVIQNPSHDTSQIPVYPGLTVD